MCHALISTFAIQLVASLGPLYLPLRGINFAGLRSPLGSSGSTPPERKHHVRELGEGCARNLEGGEARPQ